MYDRQGGGGGGGGGGEQFVHSRETLFRMSVNSPSHE